MYLRRVLPLALCLLSFTAWADQLSGRVIGISDGDTLTVLVDHTPVKIRLNAIDSPEKGQPFGNRAKQALSALCFAKDATVETSGQDRYGRTVGDVTCDGIQANAEMVRQGLAWVYRRYAKKGSPLFQLEEEARTAERGLWSDAEPVPPWEWRAARRAPVAP